MKRSTRASKFFETTVHFSFAAFSRPGAAFKAKLSAVFFEVLVSHWSVILRFTLRLVKWEKLFVATLQDIEFRVMEVGILVLKPISFSNEAAHTWAALR